MQTTDADDKTTFWIYSQSGQVLYTSEARRSQNLSYIYLGNTQVATRAVAWGTGTETIRYQHTDALGSPVAETDAAGNVTKRNSYAPYGEAYGTTSIDGTGYTGHVMDRDTGLTYMQQRYYDAQIGRFLSVDPVSVNPGDGSNFGRYWYANDNTYRFKDPDGRFGEATAAGCAITIEVGCAPGAAVGLVVDIIAWGTVAYLGYKGIEWVADNSSRHDGDGVDEPAARPPPGSKPIDKTPWSGDHGGIKGAVGAGPKDKVFISPSGQVWVQNPDGSWTNHGDASDYTGSGKASGEKGKDREGDRQRQRDAEERERERQREQEQGGNNNDHARNSDT